MALAAFGVGVVVTAGALLWWPGHPDLTPAAGDADRQVAEAQADPVEPSPSPGTSSPSPDLAPTPGTGSPSPDPDDPADADDRANGLASSEPEDGDLREGIGGESRPSGSEYAIPEGYPHGGNTGVIGAGLDYGDLEVHEGNLTVDTDGAVIEDLDIRGSLTIQADDVTVRRVRVLADTSLYGLDWRGGSGWEGVSGLLVEDTEIFNQSNEGRAVAGAGDGTFRRINAYGGATVFYASSGARVEDSFIHDPLVVSGGHHDGIQSSGGTGPEVVRSTVLGHYQSQTSALILQSNFSPKSGVVLQDNFLAGGNFTIYISAKEGMPHPANVTVTGNLWQADSWQYGPARTKVGDNWTWEGNRTTDDTPVDIQ